MTISVYLADDHRLMAEGFRSALQRHGVQVVGVTHTLDRLPVLFADSRADVLVIDVRFDVDGTRTGLDVCESILRSNPSARIVVFSQFDDSWIVERAYSIGALAFVRKDEDTSILLEAIRAAKSGCRFESPAIMQMLAFDASVATNPIRLLDEREMQIFRLIADGYQLADIATTLGYTYKTITVSARTIKDKLQIDSPADFAKLAIKYGLTNLDLRTKT